MWHHRLSCSGRFGVYASGFALLVSCVLVGCGTSKNQVEPASTAGTLTAAKVSLPNLGQAWITGEGNGLRQIIGVAGAAHLGAAQFPDFANGIAAPKGDFAVLAKSDGTVAIAKLPDGAPHAIGETLPQAQHFAMNSTGSSVVSFSPGAPTISVLTGLPDTPNVRSVNVTDGKLVSAAISDSGVLLVAVRNSDGVAVQWIGSGEARGTVANLSDFGGMQFLASSNDALIADSKQDVVSLAKSIGSQLSIVPIASASEGVKQPVAVAGSADHRWAIVAQQRSVLRIDLTHRSPTLNTQCNCSPSELLPLSGNSNFRLTSGDARPQWMYDGDTKTPRVVFIPLASNGGN